MNSLELLLVNNIDINCISNVDLILLSCCSLQVSMPMAEKRSWLLKTSSSDTFPIMDQTPLGSATTRSSTETWMAPYFSMISRPTGEQFLPPTSLLWVKVITTLVSLDSFTILIQFCQRMQFHFTKRASLFSSDIDFLSFHFLCPQSRRYLGCDVYLWIINECWVCSLSSSSSYRLDFK